MKLPAIALILLCLCAASSAAEPSMENSESAPTTQETATKAKEPAKPAQPAPKKETVKTEAELSGVTSETADNFTTRFNFSRSSKARQFFVKSGYGLQETRTYNAKGAVNKQDVNSYNIDAQYRIDNSNRYKFVSAFANIKNRVPGGKKSTSGYYSFAVGIGFKLGSGLSGETALAAMKTYDHSTNNRVTLVQALRMKHDLSGNMTLDGDMRIIRPFVDDPLLDSRMNLTYKLTDGVGLRLTYIANNLLAPTTSRSGWDKSLRLSLTFSSVGK